MNRLSSLDTYFLDCIIQNKDFGTKLMYRVSDQQFGVVIKKFLDTSPHTRTMAMSGL